MFKNLDFEALGVSGHQSELIELTLSYGFKGFDLDLAAFAHQGDQNIAGFRPVDDHPPIEHRLRRYSRRDGSQ